MIDRSQDQKPFKFYDHLAKLDLLIKQGQQEISPVLYQTDLLSQVLPRCSLQDKIIYLEKYLPLLTLMAQHEYQNQHNHPEQYSKLGWDYYTYTEANFAPGDGSDLYKLYLILDSIAVKLSEIIVELVKLTATTGLNKQNAHEHNFITCVKLVIKAEAIDARLFPNTARSHPWITLRQKITHQVLENTIYSFSLGPVLKSSQTSFLGISNTSYYRVIDAEDLTSDLSKEKQMLVGLAMLSHRQEILIETDTNFITDTVKEVIKNKSLFERLGKIYHLTWQELDGFMHAYFLPFYCAGTPVNNLEKKAKRDAIADLLYAYYQFTINSQTVAEDHCRSVAYCSFLLTQLLRGDNKAIAILAEYSPMFHQALMIKLEDIPTFSDFWQQKIVAPLCQARDIFLRNNYSVFPPDELSELIAEQQELYIMQVRKNLSLPVNKSRICFADVVSKAFQDYLARHQESPERFRGQKRICAERVDEQRRKGQSPYKLSSSGVSPALGCVSINPRTQQYNNPGDPFDRLSSVSVSKPGHKRFV